MGMGEVCFQDATDWDRRCNRKWQTSEPAKRLGEKRVQKRGKGKEEIIYRHIIAISSLERPGGGGGGGGRELERWDGRWFGGIVSRKVVGLKRKPDDHRGGMDWPE
ncbi:hypothetical protein GLAREA_05253 [Glarea lozoyensis ATCC 20868]|uniref:Uncharacterized protein n=1 Tax=Glarea lozoyensis (strain ATCC 20868 / MF5171) TaxID=1116229 RepID=S3DDU1_GLAL2|nr:uncharacterized protein GLAREA_05253 [Glarea lozoyensis ATCC 20868]EPE35915.1 hypothetical protein GLAREA_05253 [Glarea lozoyensis ATCC 20868]